MNLNALVRRWVLRDPLRYRDLHASMISSRAGITLESYLSRLFVLAFLGGIAAAVCGWFIAGFFIHYEISGTSGFFFFLSLDMPPSMAGIPSPVLLQSVGCILFSVLVFFLIYFVGLKYPGLATKNRSTRINLTLHNAVAYMYAMRRGGAQLIAIFESISENAGIYGEVAYEFRQVIRDTGFFGYDVVTAVRHLMETTPSQKFREFLQDMLSVIESGGNLTTFFGDRVRLYQDEARLEQKNFLNVLGLVAEGYVTLFVAGPLFLIIIMVVMGMMGGVEVVQFSVVTYALLPIGSFIFILLIDMMGTKAEVYERYTKKRQLNEYSEITLEESGNEQQSFAQLVRYDRIRDIRQWVSHPVASFIDNYKLTLLVTVPVAAVYLVLVLVQIPAHLDLETFIDFVDDQIIIAMLIILIPFGVFYELWRNKVRSIESLLPEFLERMAGINEVGLTVAQAISILVNAQLGLLSYEIRKIKLDMDWGSNFSEALVRFEHRVRTALIGRTVVLITKASQMSGSISEVLHIAGSDARMNEILRKERSSEMFIYTAIVYLSFFVFIFVVGVISVQFLPMLTNLTSTQAQIGPLSRLGAFPFMAIGRLLYHTCLIQAILSGLIAGQMGEGSLGAGVKHSCILLITALIAFNVLI